MQLTKVMAGVMMAGGLLMIIGMRRIGAHLCMLGMLFIGLTVDNPLLKNYSKVSCICPKMMMQHLTLLSGILYVMTVKP